MFHFLSKYNTILNMKKNIKVSIIVPVYNTAKYLHQCLDSIKNQSLREIEIICINDGSVDNSLEILNGYAKEDSRFIILSQKNQGQATARNKGIQISNGQFIGFVDSDDFIEHTMFEKLYKNATENNSDITMCCIKTLSDATGEIDQADPYMTLDLFPKELNNKVFNHSHTSDFIFRICVMPWNKIYKRDFLLKNNILFPEGLFFEDNVFFYSSFFQAKRISLIKQKLYIYRKASETSTTYGDDAKKLDFFEIFEIIESFLKENDFYTDLEDYYRTYKKNTLIYWYKKITNKKTKQEYFNKLTNLYNDIDQIMQTNL